MLITNLPRVTATFFPAHYYFLRLVRSSRIAATPEKAKPYINQLKTPSTSHSELRRPIQNDVHSTHETRSNKPPLRFCEAARRALSLAKTMSGPFSLTIALDNRQVARLAIINAKVVISWALSDNQGRLLQ